jgi:carbamoyltransferase
MLFEPRMRDDWGRRVPAAVHLGGSARLADHRAFRLLGHRHGAGRVREVSGIPVLCDTSANLNGHGFFPDVASAAAWGRTRYVWSEGKLYTNPDSTLGGTVAPGDR